MAKRRVGKYPKAFRKMAVERLKGCENIVALSQELGVHRRLLYKWRDQLETLDHGEGPAENGKERELRLQVAHLKRLAADRLMREDNLLAVQPKAFVVTTDSQHELEVYLNLASRMKLTGVNQLWVADITYIRLHREFVFLAVILDAFSRKVIGWELERTLAARSSSLVPAARVSR